MPIDFDQEGNPRRTVPDPSRPPIPNTQIAVLPSDLADQIAAGEVVERPASVVKELAENSIDAGATEVHVLIEAGGRARIQVRDNGCGMSEQAVLVALKRHATSKLRTSEDLGAIATLGFRGEALPSIASVSRLTLVSRRTDDLEGVEVHVAAGHVERVRPAACPAGTEITVADLFYNTPARLKFLKTEATERRHIQDALTRLALARTYLGVRFVSDGRTLLDVPPSPNLHERAAAALGPGLAEQLYPMPPSVRGEVRATGLFGSPKATQRNARTVYTFVNGRYVRDRRIQAAVMTAYSGLVERGRYPCVIVHIEVPIEAVDVNVHPTKTEVRFDEPDLVFRAVRGGLVEGLAATPWVPKTKERGRVYVLDQAPRQFDAEQDDQAMGGTAHLDDRVPQIALTSNLRPSTLPVQQTLPGTRRLSGDTGERGGWWTGPQPQEELLDELRNDASGAQPRAGYFGSLNYLGRLGDLYLLCQDDEGLVVVDQHAAHERISFERLREIYRGHHRQIQNLLLPVRLDLDPVQASAIEEHQDFFTTIGFDLETFGGDTYLLRSVPAILIGARYERLIKDALDELAQFGHTLRVDEAVDAVLSRLACHGSVRGGDVMKPAEVEALLLQMDMIDYRANCPHGRPVYFRLTWGEIERRFERR